MPGPTRVESSTASAARTVIGAQNSSYGSARASQPAASNVEHVGVELGPAHRGRVPRPTVSD